MTILGFVILAVTGAIIWKWIEENGLVFAFNFGRIGFMIWGLSLGLYDLALSELYKPNLIVNIIGMITMANFLFISSVFKLPITKQIDYFSCSNTNEKSGYKIAVIFTMALAVLSFYVNYRVGGLRYFTHQTTKDNFRLGYFLHLSTCVAVYFWIKARKSQTIFKRFLFFLLSLIFMLLILADMSRSPLVLFATAVGIYELSAYVKKTGNLSRKKILFVLVAAVALVVAFGAIGDKRASIFFKNGILDFYKIKILIPDSFAWCYMYLTASIENTRYIIDSNLNIPLTYGNFLLYPVIKIFANIVGLGSDYALFFRTLTRYPAYLWRQYGLNACSFIGSAITDFGYPGIFIYLMLYDFVAWIWYRFMKTSKITNDSKVILSALLFQIPLFSVFAPSIFGIAFIWVNVFFVLIWNLANLVLPNLRTISIRNIRIKF